MDKEIYWLWYTDKKTLTKKVKYDLYKEFDDIEALYNCSSFDDFKFLSADSKKELEDKSLKNYDRLFELYRKNDVTLLSIDKEEYPQNLHHLNIPPLLLYCRGKFINLNERVCVSVVGTRKITDYGKNCTRNITYDLASNGVVIISGMAYGVDAEAHRAALDAKMPTVAVIGTGVNIVYPKSNARLMKDIIETGMIISEYPLNTEAEKFHFPERNRIISALSEATLVVEADIKSGSLITASYSNDLGRDVYAVPGSIYSIYSKGTNSLIRDGAYLTTCAEDILSNYRLKYSDLLIKGMKDKSEHNNIEETPFDVDSKIIQHSSTDSDEEDIILNLLENNSYNIDEIHQKTNIPISVLNQKLLLMELSEKIMKLPGNNYRKIMK